MLESVQTSTNQQHNQYWNMFAKSGDPQMYLNYRRGKSASKKQHEDN